MEIEARLRDNRVTILIEDLDLSKLVNLTEQTVKECVRPLIKSRYILTGADADQAERVSNLVCYGTHTSPLVSEEDGCSRRDSESPEVGEERQ